MTGKNGWGSERVEDGGENVKREGKEQKRGREKRALHPSGPLRRSGLHSPLSLCDSGSAVSWRTRLLWSLAAAASRHRAHDVSRRAESREPRAESRAQPRTHALMQLLGRLQDRMQQGAPAVWLSSLRTGRRCPAGTLRGWVSSAVRTQDSHTAEPLVSKHLLAPSRCKLRNCVVLPPTSNEPIPSGPE